MVVSLPVDILQVLSHVFGLIHRGILIFKIRHFRFENGEGKDIHRNWIGILFMAWKQQVPLQSK